MLDRPSTLAHRLRVCIKALLHCFEQMLILPSGNPPLRPRRALGFDRAILTGCSPVAPYPLAVFLAREAIWQDTGKKACKRYPSGTNDPSGEASFLLLIRISERFTNRENDESPPSDRRGPQAEAVWLSFWTEHGINVMLDNVDAAGRSIWRVP